MKYHQLKLHHGCLVISFLSKTHIFEVILTAFSHLQTFKLYSSRKWPHCPVKEIVMVELSLEHGNELRTRKPSFNLPYLVKILTY